MLSIFSAISSYPDKIRYSRSAHSVVEICAVLLHFSYMLANKITFMRVQRNCGVLKVKYACAKTVNYVTQYAFSSVIIAF
jgi:hypothetical protein